MIEGTLYPGKTPGSYTIGSQNGNALNRGQKVAIQLGGNWIAGTVAYSSSYIDTSASEPDPIYRNRGTYAIADDEITDPVTESSLESFPASDPPAWSITHHKRSPQQQHAGCIINGYYFVADDGGICGLCAGIHVRTT